MNINYIRTTLETMTQECPEVHPDSDLIRLYALLALVKGSKTTLADIHDAWALWCERINPEHSNIMSFDMLDRAIQELDAPYRAAVIRTAHVIGR